MVFIDLVFKKKKNQMTRKESLNISNSQTKENLLKTLV